MARVSLGDKVKDRVTGVSGIVMGITTWLTGCDTVSVQPQEMKDGKAVDRSQFDVTTLDVIEKGVVKPYTDERQNEAVPARPAKAGGPHQHVERPR